MAAAVIFLAANNATTTLASNITNIQTSVPLAAGTGAEFPSPGTNEQFALTVVDAATGLLTEVMYCTSRSGDTLTVVRGQEGTAAAAWSAGDPVGNFMTAGTFKTLKQVGGDYAVAGGSANAITVALNPPVTTRVTGINFRFKAAASNTTAVTVDYGAGPINVKMPPSTDFPIVGLIANGLVYNCTDDGTVIQISEVNNLISVGIAPDQTVAAVPNDGAQHTILSTFAGQGGGMLLVSGDDGSGNAFTDLFPIQQLSNTTITPISSTTGVPGTRTYICPPGSPSSVAIVRQNGVGPATINLSVKFIQK